MISIVEGNGYANLKRRKSMRGHVAPVPTCCALYRSDIVSQQRGFGGDSIARE